MRNIDRVIADNLTVDNRRKIRGIAGNTTIQEIVNGNALIEIPVCKACSDIDIILDGSVTVVDGINIENANLVLVANQTDLKENGIYIPLATGWVRWEDFRAGCLVIVLEGDTYENTIWKNDNYELDFGIGDITFTLLEFGGGTLPDGTANNSTLRWNGTDWVESVKHQATIGVSENGYQILSPDGGVSSFIGARNTQLAQYLNYKSGKYAYTFIDGGVSYFDVNQGSGRGRTLMRAIHTFGADNIIYYIDYGATRYFSIKQNGTIFSNVLTANTVLLSNANKEIVSLTAGSNGQVLTQKAGGAVWENVPTQENRHSFNPADANYFNEITGATTLTAVPGMSVSLLADKRYYIEMNLYFGQDGAMDNPFEIEVYTNSSGWSHYLMLTLGQHLNKESTSEKVFVTNLDTAYEYFTNDGGVTIGIMNIRGHVTTDSAGNLTLRLRNTIVGYADNTRNIKVLLGSEIIATECKVN